MAFIPLDTLSSPWKLGHKISKGAFGVVYVSADDGHDAIKVSRTVGAVMGECLAEVRHLRHENLLLVERVIATRRGAFVRMRLVEGDELFHVARKVSDRLIMTVLMGLISATSYLHTRGCVHRDIKPENIVLSTDGGRAVLVDLGSLKKIGERAITQGTYLYQAPEAKGRKFQIVTTSLDDWSVGATIATVAAGRPINSVDACLRSLKWRRLFIRPTVRCIIGEVAGMLTVDPSDRMSVRSLFRVMRSSI
jgi:serine/threonine protein kinase